MKIRERKLNRCPWFNYSLDGCYFITTCVKNFVRIFGEVNNGQMALNKYGEIVKQQLLWLPKQFPHIRLNEWCVMPNHVHAIIVIDRATGNAGGVIVGTGRDLSLPVTQNHQSTIQPTKIKSLSEIVGAFKTTSSKLIHQSGSMQFQWQRSFHDHVIRDNDDLERVRWYIQNNPDRWRRDKNNSY